MDAATLAEGIAKLNRQPRIQGAAMPGDPPLLLFRLPQEVVSLTRHSDGQFVHFFMYATAGLFGGCRNVLATFKRFDATTNVCVLQEDEAFDFLDNARYNAVFVHNNRPVFGWEVEDLEGISELGSRWSVVKEQRLEVFEPTAHFWSALCSLSEDATVFNNVLRPHMTKRELLSLGWMYVYERRLWDIREQLDDLSKRDKRPLSVLREETADSVKRFFQVVEASDYRLQTILDYLADEYDQLANVLAIFRDNVGTYAHFDQWDYATLLRETLETYLWSSRLSDCGQVVIWSDPVEGSLKRMNLEPQEFSPDFPPENYWRRLIWDLPSSWGHLVDGKSIPVDSQELFRFRDTFPSTVDMRATLDATKVLLAEAFANKRFTIPIRAVVEMQIGVFSHLELLEIESDVIVALRTPNNEFYIIFVSPQYDICGFIFPRGAGTAEDIDRKESIEAAVKLLIAGIIRDFWVMEERETVFTTKAPLPVKSPRQHDEDEPRVVYLPRVRYTRPADTTRCTQELGHRDRRVHFVSPHLRKADQASEIQLVLAQRYGFQVPQGYTFVRPHERGIVKHEVIYRSWSALRSLYTVIESGVEGDGAAAWFRFERDVYRLMETLDFTVEHVAASRRGDNGVDVYATKGNDLEQVNWIIQCKCWAPHRKVGPGVVQRLIGTLTEYPHGTRGMIVTTSSFTQKAKEKADSHSVRLMDGAEFLRRLGG